MAIDNFVANPVIITVETKYQDNHLSDKYWAFSFTSHSYKKRLIWSLQKGYDIDTI